MSKPGIEGRIDITLQVTDSAVKKVSIHSSRPIHVSRVLLGNTPEKSLMQIPLLYSICGTAQACVALGAIEQAMDIPPVQRVEIARSMLVWMETAREHLWRILIDWPKFIGEEVAPESLKGLMQHLPNFQRALFKGGQAFNLHSKLDVDPVRIEACILELETRIAEFVLGTGTDKWLTASAPVAWADLQPTPAARLLQQLKLRHWDAAGRCDSELLPVLDSRMLNLLLAQEGAMALLSKPQWQGICCETTPFARVRAGQAKGNNGLSARLLSLLTELAGIPARLRCMLDDVLAEQAAPEIPEQEGLPKGVGLRQIEAARGRLVHRVRIESGVISEYQILAPTEWNFHPQGVVKQGLQSLEGSPEEIKRQANLFVNAVDPCVGYHLSIVH